jgi:hypothetical protein
MLNTLVAVKASTDCLNIANADSGKECRHTLIILLVFISVYRRPINKPPLLNLPELK